MQFLHESLVNHANDQPYQSRHSHSYWHALVPNHFDNLNCWCLCSHIKNRNIDLLPQSLQLINGCWTIDIRRNHHWTSFLFLNQLISQFTSKGRFTSPLKTTIIMIVGIFEDFSISDVSDPRISVNSSLTILMICCEASRVSMIS